MGLRPRCVSVRGVRGAAERRGRAGHGLLPAGLRRGGPGLPGAGVGFGAQLQVTSAVPTSSFRHFDPT